MDRTTIKQLRRNAQARATHRRERLRHIFRRLSGVHTPRFETTTRAALGFRIAQVRALLNTACKKAALNEPGKEGG
jgi:hypothetical protein